MISEREVFTSLCLNGVGKGRIEHHQNKYLFDYKARHDQKDKNWIIGVDLPLSGQEVLFFDYKSVTAKGPFAFRLRKQDINGEMKHVYELLAELLNMIDKKSLSKGWRLEAGKGDLVKLSKGRDLSARFFSMKDSRYRRTILSFSKNPNDFFRLHLFSDSCTL